MKRLTALLLLAALLAGCSPQGASPATEPTETTAATEATSPMVEVSLDEVPGADASFPMFTLTDHSCARIIPWGDEHYALFTTTGELLKLRREDLTVESARELMCPFSGISSCIAATETQLCYFDEWQSTVFILDADLQTVAQFPIAEEILAGPVMAADFSCLYYSTEAGIRAMDTATGLSRLVRQEHGPVICVEGLLRDGTILHYTRLVNNDQLEHCFIHTADGTLTENGKLDSTDPSSQVITWEDRYAALTRLALPTADTYQISSGTADAAPDVTFFLPAAWADVCLTDDGRLFVQTLSEAGLVLELYDLSSGAIVASTTVSQRSETFPCAQSDGEALWLWDDHQVRLYRWDYAQTAAQGKNLSDLQSESFTMEQVEEKRLEMEAAYGISIQITNTHNRTGEAWLPREYQNMLELLDSAMAKFPAGFFTSLQDTLAIELVDDFDSHTGTYPSTGSMDIGETLTIQVSMCADLQAIFYHELFHAMELHIQSNSSRLTQWESQNPKSFEYASLEAYASGSLSGSEFLVPGSNAAADAYALVSAREDRAQTFMYAMMDGEAARFDSSVMEDKLELLCGAIRDAFGWKKSDAVFPWEQYL